jgi:cytochrome c biogenesis protein CcdA
MKNKEKISVQPMDERQSQITQKSIVFGFLFLVACLLAATIYKIVTTGDAGWELFAIVGASAVILIARRLMGDVEQPLDYKNRPLPTGNTKPEKMARIKNYAVNSVIFGLVFAVMDIVLLLFSEHEVSDYKLTQVIFPNLSEGLTLAITAVIAFVTMFAVSFVIDYLVGEFYKVLRYNKMIAELENEE